MRLRAPGDRPRRAGLDPEAGDRHGRPRRRRRRHPPAHGGGRRPPPPPVAWSPATSPSSAAATRCWPPRTTSPGSAASRSASPTSARWPRPWSPPGCAASRARWSATSAATTTVRNVADWPPRYLDQRQTGPLSALALNDGFEQYPTPDEPGAPVGPPPSPPQTPPPRFTDAARARAWSGRRATRRRRSRRRGRGGRRRLGAADRRRRPAPRGERQQHRRAAAEGARPRRRRRPPPRRARRRRRLLGDGSVDATGRCVADGSGLSLENRVTCDLLVDLLAREGTGPAVQDRLAVAGESGTLRGAVRRGRRWPAPSAARPARSTRSARWPVWWRTTTRPCCSPSWSTCPRASGCRPSAVAAQQALGEALLAWPAGARRRRPRAAVEAG